MNTIEKVLAAAIGVGLILSLYSLVYPKTGSIDVGAISQAVYSDVYGKLSTTFTLGAAGSPAINNDGCGEFNGVTHCYYRSAFTRASTTCQFNLPSASSTLIAAVAMVTNARGTATVGEWGVSKDINSTSTSLGYRVLAAGVYGTITASSSGFTTNVDTANVLPANGKLAFKIGSTTPTTQGICVAEVISAR